MRDNSLQLSSAVFCVKAVLSDVYFMTGGNESAPARL